MALLIAEGASRLLRLAPEVKAIDLEAVECVYQRSTNPILGFELKANYRNDQPDFIQTYERTNTHGQRDRERTLSKPEGVRRVLLLGDSVVEGHGLPEQDTISHQWEALYRDQSTEVLNFGVSAYCTLAEIELLERKGLAFDPNIVVVLFVENDFDNFNREAFALGEPVERPALVKGLFRQSHLFRHLALRLNLFHFRADADPVSWNKEAIGDNNVTDGFQRLRALAEREGFKPLIALWPRFQDNDIVDLPPVDVAEQLAAMHGLPSARMSVFFKTHWNQTDNPRVTFTSGDGLHPSAKGTAIAAAALKKLIDDVETGKLVPKPAEREPSVLAKARSLGETKPNYARVYHTQGVKFLQEGQYKQAIGEFTTALQEDPKHAGAHGNMGLAYERLGNRLKAKQHYQKAITLQDDFVQAHFNLARLLVVEGDTRGALPLFRRTLEIDPHHTDALNTLGMELGKAGQFAEARTYLERAIEVEPNFSEAHNNLGTVYAATGQLEKAVEQFKEAVRADPNNQGAVSRLKQVKEMLRARQ